MSFGVLSPSWRPVLFMTEPPASDLYTLSLTTLFRSASGDARRRRADRGVGPERRSLRRGAGRLGRRRGRGCVADRAARAARDRKSTRLNSSHPSISYAVFCLKKKKARIRP